MHSFWFLVPSKIVFFRSAGILKLAGEEFENARKPNLQFGDFKFGGGHFFEIDPNKILISATLILAGALEKNAQPNYFSPKF